MPLIAVLLMGVSLRAAPSDPFRYERLGALNGCFVEAVAFGDALRTRSDGKAWFRLLQWGAKEADEVVAGHAVVVFEDAQRLWCYDINHGFKALNVPVEQRAEVEVVAKEATAPYLGKSTPYFPIYREDFPQSADPKPPAPFEDVEERELRDVGRVAARLALHRRVKMLEFEYPQDGVTRRGAAVAFVYSGRLCVYSAHAGTMPFRVSALTVENLRQLQEVLRRMYPGASNLKVR